VYTHNALNNQVKIRYRTGILSTSVEIMYTTFIHFFFICTNRTEDCLHVCMYMSRYFVQVFTYFNLVTCFYYVCACVCVCVCVVPEVPGT